MSYRITLNLKKLSILCFAYERPFINYKFKIKENRLNNHFHSFESPKLSTFVAYKCYEAQLRRSYRFGFNPIKRILQKSNFRLPSIDFISFPGYCSAIRRILTKHATNNTRLLRCVWMSHKLQMFENNGAFFWCTNTCHMPKTGKVPCISFLTDTLSL